MLVGSAVVSASFVVKAVDPTSDVPYNGIICINIENNDHIEMKFIFYMCQTRNFVSIEIYIPTQNFGPPDAYPQ